MSLYCKSNEKQNLFTNHQSANLVFAEALSAPPGGEARRPARLLQRVEAHAFRPLQVWGRKRELYHKHWASSTNMCSKHFCQGEGGLCKNILGRSHFDTYSFNTRNPRKCTKFFLQFFFNLEETKNTELQKDINSIFFFISVSIEAYAELICSRKEKLRRNKFWSEKKYRELDWETQSSASREPPDYALKWRHQASATYTYIATVKKRNNAHLQVMKGAIRHPKCFKKKRKYLSKFWKDSMLKNILEFISIFFRFHFKNWREKIEIRSYTFFFHGSNICLEVFFFNDFIFFGHFWGGWVPAYQ